MGDTVDFIIKHWQAILWTVMFVFMAIVGLKRARDDSTREYFAIRNEQVDRIRDGTSIGVKKGIQELLTDPNIIKVLNSGVSINVQISPDGTQNIIIGGYNNSVNRYLNNI